MSLFKRQVELRVASISVALEEGQDQADTTQMEIIVLEVSKDRENHLRKVGFLILNSFRYQFLQN